MNNTILIEMLNYIKSITTFTPSNATPKSIDYSTTGDHVQVYIMTSPIATTVVNTGTIEQVNEFLSRYNLRYEFDTSATQTLSLGGGRATLSGFLCHEEIIKGYALQNSSGVSQYTISIPVDNFINNVKPVEVKSEDELLDSLISLEPNDTNEVVDSMKDNPPTIRFKHNLSSSGYSFLPKNPLATALFKNVELEKDKDDEQLFCLRYKVTNGDLTPQEALIAINKREDGKTLITLEKIKAEQDSINFIQHILNSWVYMGLSLPLQELIAIRDTNPRAFYLTKTDVESIMLNITRLTGITDEQEIDEFMYSVLSRVLPAARVNIKNFFTQQLNPDPYMSIIASSLIDSRSIAMTFLQNITKLSNQAEKEQVGHFLLNMVRDRLFPAKDAIVAEKEGLKYYLTYTTSANSEQTDKANILQLLNMKLPMSGSVVSYLPLDEVRENVKQYNISIDTAIKEKGLNDQKISELMLLRQESQETIASLEVEIAKADVSAQAALQVQLKNEQLTLSNIDEQLLITQTKNSVQIPSKILDTSVPAVPAVLRYITGISSIPNDFGLIPGENVSRQVDLANLKNLTIFSEVVNVNEGIKVEMNGQDPNVILAKLYEGNITSFQVTFKFADNVTPLLENVNIRTRLEDFFNLLGASIVCNQVVDSLYIDSNYTSSTYRLRLV